ncbi:uncharacterized protein THITE_157914 [Thermothielavioides terrestris NRRL 8126]|uniref:Uncharacterized protein n=1 Tax=Thermothielavioides terrestris (strain ATCC 38088 / NRRL 8126) TaxID=578455 RepID=G2QXH4_THETT|nr:uncharacterized protein THITE_157914 [Thermothielavioides terrestris NRRL 8126]AEO63999.1 hypothetical protein THITE_157914 [Thermothielavioides terrestris NRRL 8126]
MEIVDFAECLKQVNGKLQFHYVQAGLCSHRHRATLMETVNFRSLNKCTSISSNGRQSVAEEELRAGLDGLLDEIR